MNHRNIEDNLACPICHERFQVPIQLPCQHTYCLSCLQRIVPIRFPCPECRAVHQVPNNGVNGFPASIKIQQLLDAMPLSNEDPKCPGCKERFQTPKELPCHHTYCLSCLEKSVPPRFPCPECRAVHEVPYNGVERFPKARAIQRFLDAMPLPNEPSISRPQVPGGNKGSSPFANLRLDPTCPPLDQQHQNMQQTNLQEDLELRLAIEVSAVENQQRQSRSHNASEERGRSNQVTTNRTEQRNYLAEQSYENVFHKGRKYIRQVLGRIVKSQEIILMTTVALYSLLTCSRLVAGAVKLASDCPLERKVAVYLFVKSLVAILFWGLLILWLYKSALDRALDNRFIQVYLVLDTLFSLIWLFVGTAWLIGNFNEIKLSCPNYKLDWNQHFINFALFLTGVDYICMLALLFYTAYIICEPDKGNNQLV